MLFNKLGSLIVPQHVVEDQQPPEAFVRKLQRTFGPDMHVEWNPRKQRWVIEQCVQHHGSDLPNEHGIVPHTQLCRKVYAWLVRDESDDSFMSLCDRVIEKLHEKETYRQFGTGEAALARWRQHSKEFDDAQAAKQRAMIHDVIRHSRKDNRTIVNKFVEMFRRHDMRPNK